MARIVLDPQLVEYLAEHAGVLTISRGIGDERGKWIVSVTGDDVRREVSDTLGLALATVVTDILPPADPVDVPDNPTDRQRIEAVAKEHGWTATARVATATAFTRSEVDLLVDWHNDRASYAALDHDGKLRELVAANKADRRDIVLGVLVQSEHDPMTRALASAPPLATPPYDPFGPESAAPEPNSRAEQLAEAAETLDAAAIRTTARLRLALDIAEADTDEVDQLVRTVKAAAETAIALRHAADEARHAAADPEQRVDPAVVVRLRSQLDQIREAASMAHQAQTPGTAAFVLADEILTLARCGA